MSAPGAGRMPAFAAALRARRDQTDRLLRQAHAGGLGGSIRSVVDDLAAWEPIVARSPAPQELAVAVLEIACDLAGTGRWRSTAPGRVTLTRLAPTLSWFTGEGPSAHTPTDALRALTQAASRVVRDVSLSAWIQRLGLAQDPGEKIREAIAVAAWRSGSPRLREAALAASQALPPHVLAAVLEVSPSEVDAVLLRHGGDRWWWPRLPERAVLARLGGSICAGGPWLSLPVVVSGGPSGWAVVADGRSWAVVADIHGATFVPLPDAHGLTTLRPTGLEAQVMARVNWADQVTGLAFTAPEGPAPGVALVSRAHSYRLDVVRVAQ